MNIFMREVRSNWKSLLFWCLGMALLVGACLGKFAGINDMGADISSLMKLYPKTLMAVFGLGTFNVSTLLGYYGVCYQFLLLVAGLHAVMLGCGIVSKEERGKTAEFLMTKPVPRTRILLYKLLISLISVASLNIICWGVSEALMLNYADISYYSGKLAVLMIGMLAFQLLFLSIGFATAACFGKARISDRSVLLFFIFYVLKFAADIAQSNVLNNLTPFGFLSASHIVVDGKAPVLAVIISFVISAGLVYLAFRRYPERDLTV